MSNLAAKRDMPRANAGDGPVLAPLDIGHEKYIALVEPDTAFWSLVKKNRLADLICDPAFLELVREHAHEFATEMETLRYGLTPSAVYFNPTERCNLNCTYCYLPEAMRRRGIHMSQDDLFRALETLRDFFHQTMPANDRPQVIFHGSEPLMNRKAIFTAIDHFGDDFVFGIQTNGTLLDDGAIEFLTSRQVSIGLSLDGPLAEITDRTRHTFSGHSVHDRVLKALNSLRGYESYSVICTATSENLEHLTGMVELLHSLEVPTCMLNPVRCTLDGGRRVRPSDLDLAAAYKRALDRSYQLYLETGRKLIVANFANILLAIVAPTARRLMCDISPCGGGRCFFAVDAHGALFPCSEFIGIEGFKGGNIFSGDLQHCFDTSAFRSVTQRGVEMIEPCEHCAFRHFCGAPCPAEAHELAGDSLHRGAFCDFYQEQARYAMRLIADGREEAYLWDGWDDDTHTTFDVNIADRKG
ncbi:MAG: peptide-modifying radical SAM enzyme CbpB [Actinomycetota bacterium]|nr:peptide-modifying radical SAM enzyme CbpB [Actinomycetota bacterium]